MWHSRHSLMVATILVPILSACTQSKDSLLVSRSSGVNDGGTAIPTVLQTQADAWNAGNLDKFMSVYLKSPIISFVSADGELHGYNALEARYRKRYGTKRDTMGTLTFSDLHIDALGESYALCIGHWHLERAGQHPMQGVFSLVFTKADGTWKIMHDHTSQTK